MTIWEGIGSKPIGEKAMLVGGQNLKLFDLYGDKREEGEREWGRERNGGAPEVGGRRPDWTKT